MSQDYFGVLSLNASRIRNLGRIRDLYAFILLLDPKVVFIQEIHIAGAFSSLCKYYWF